MMLFTFHEPKIGSQSDPGRRALSHPHRARGRGWFGRWAVLILERSILDNEKWMVSGSSRVEAYQIYQCFSFSVYLIYIIIYYIYIYFNLCYIFVY